MSIRIENPSTGGTSGSFVPYLPGSNNTLKFVDNGNVLELWWNGVLVESWTVAPVGPVVGSPIGLLLALTYS